MRFFTQSSQPKIIESRSVSLENPAISLTDPRAWSGGGEPSFSGEEITVATALQVPPVWAAVDLLSNEVASLPWQVFRLDTGGNRIKANTDPLYTILHDAVNDRMSSRDFRKTMMVNLLTIGRAYAYIEKNKMGLVRGLFLLDPNRVRITVRPDLSLEYEYRPIQGPTMIYQQDEMIDLKWMPAPDGIGHIGPIERLKNAIGLSVAAERYASKVFQNGGMAPLILSGNFSPAAAEMAAQTVQNAMRMARDNGRDVIVIDKNMTLAPTPGDPTKNQLLELRQFQVVEIARIYGIPPTMLQDLSRATYSNIEQADLHVVKHSIMHWCNAWEAECNLKLFSKSKITRYCEFNLDAAMRGSFLERMQGYMQAITAGVFTQNETRVKENLPLHEWGDNLLAPSGAQAVAGLAGAVDQDGNVAETPDPEGTEGDDTDTVSDTDPDNAPKVKTTPKPTPVANAVG